MKAMIFAAGLGSRLKPLTDTKPKALIEVAGKPMLEHVILKLKASGFDEIVINVHHFANQILDFLKANDNFGVNIYISDETEELLDTGGGLEKAGKYFMPPLHEDKEGILLHNVDILSNCDLQDLIRFHQQNPDVYATMLVSRRITSRYLLFDDNNLLCGWINKNTGQVKPAGLEYKEGKYQEYAYSGIQAINPLMLNKGMRPGKYSIIDFYLQVCRNIKIQCYPADNLQLIDIGKPETLIKAEEFLNHL
ncbi:sugar phosphate nucleotidyltransferase [Phocaeicola faecalis]